MRVRNPDIIAASILAADPLRLGEETIAALAAGVDWIHFDVMDNHYVPNLSFGPSTCQALRDVGVTAPIDVHLMMKPVDTIIPNFAKAGATGISFHVDASEDLDRTMQLIRDGGCQVGIVLSPATPLTALTGIIEQVDLILVMSVNPGFAGQSFIPDVLPKIKEVRAMINRINPAIRLEVDGGVKLNNIAALKAAGADTFVAGSAIFASNNYQETVQAMREQLNNTD